MSSSKKNVLSRVLPALAATALLLVACKDSSPTEPILAAATPTPPAESIVGTWIGTYQSKDDFDGCDTNVVYSAQATLWQNGSDAGGTLTAMSEDRRGCPLGSYTLTGTLQGGVLTGRIVLPGVTWSVRGTVAGSKLDIELVRPFDDLFGVMHLHR